MALGALAVLYVVYWPSYQIPLGVDVRFEKVGHLKYELVVEPYYARYEPSNRPAVFIILPSAREVGKPPMWSIQLSAVGPTVGEVWIDDAEVRGNVVVVRLDGKFGLVLDDWLRYLGNATGVEPSIHVHIWYGDDYLGFAAVNYDPHRLAGRNVTYVVKAQVVTAERPLKTKPRNSAGYHFSSFGLDCVYEWRYNYTIIDTERDFGGKIPLFFIYNQYSYSGEVGLLLNITKAYITAGVAVGYQIGSADITFKDLMALSFDIKDNQTKIFKGGSVFPNEAYWFGVYGKLTIDRYDEWYVCRDGGGVMSASRTGNVMFKSRIHYLSKGSAGNTLVLRERFNSSRLITALELRNYYKLLGTLVAEVSTPQNLKILNLGEWVVRQFNTQCPREALVGAPFGVILRAVKGAEFVKRHPALASIPVSVKADYANIRGVEYKAIYQNVGAAFRRGYDVVEHVDIYATGVKVKISDSCQVDLPLGYVISR
ncbi:hypothetical protein P186_2745 [Pyrobaculum ferrireducens]|uniref:Uncharacterized protein n=1 Tax=Pyrobaculum ferrireducens TaxID=1104324 RepID=G7VEV9_9CREN|nr:hypothetical protein P186_2745 [Pyrobaculum ferrireducens]